MTTPHDTFITNLLYRTAQAAIGPSALRKQGASGVISAAREAAAKIDVRKLSECNVQTFPAFLNEATDALLNRFPDKAKNWGAARKAINLYFRDLVYNADLSMYFQLKPVRELLEVPLDKDVATGLLDQPEGKSLPKWTSIKGLQPKTSAAYQAVAAKVASRHQVCRVDLDVFFWRAR